MKNDHDIVQVLGGTEATLNNQLVGIGSQVAKRYRDNCTSTYLSEIPSLTDGDVAQLNLYRQKRKKKRVASTDCCI